MVEQSAFDVEALKSTLKTLQTAHPVVEGSVVDNAETTYEELLPAQLPPKRMLPELPKNGLSIKFINKMLPWVENFWATKKRYPTTNEIIAQFGLPRDEVLYINSNKLWLNCLKRRGIRAPNVAEDFLSTKQQAAIAVVTNFNDKRHKDLKLLSIGCSLEEYNGWLSDPTFKSALNARSDEVLNHIGVDANIGLANLIQKEDFRAIKFYFEITGKAASPEAINVKQTMQILIEAVQKHVRDPATLEAIASEVNQLRAIQGL